MHGWVLTSLALFLGLLLGPPRARLQAGRRRSKSAYDVDLRSTKRLHQRRARAAKGWLAGCFFKWKSFARLSIRCASIETSNLHPARGALGVEGAINRRRGLRPPKNAPSWLVRVRCIAPRQCIFTYQRRRFLRLAFMEGFERMHLPPAAPRFPSVECRDDSRGGVRPVSQSAGEDGRRARRRFGVHICVGALHYTCICEGRMYLCPSPCADAT